jgi:hypothetical protein
MGNILSKPALLKLNVSNQNHKQMRIQYNKAALSMLEAPWLKTQIETHLFFGFCSRQFPFALFIAGTCFLYFIYEVFAAHGPFAARLLGQAQYLFFILVGLYLLKLPKYHQAAIGWWVTKISLFFVCLAMVIAGGLVGLIKGNPDYLHEILIGFLWLPSIEFIPRLTEKQKFITIGRVLLSIPLLILWQQTGTWHWE